MMCPQQGRPRAILSFPESLSGLLIFFKNKFIYLFIYFWLHWVFGAAHGLSLVAASRDKRGYSLLW